MNTKIKLNPPEPVIIAEPGKASVTLTVSNAELREISVRLQNGALGGMIAVYVPLGEDGKQVPYSQVIRKQWTPGETLALGFDKPLTTIVSKIIPD